MTRRIKLPSPVKYEQLDIRNLNYNNGVLYLDFERDTSSEQNNMFKQFAHVEGDWADIE